MRDILSKLRQGRERDAKEWKEHDEDLCMLCHAHGADKRSLFLRCFYDIKEVVPEALDLFDTPMNGHGFYLRICKSCRGRLLKLLKEWRTACLNLRDEPKDHDGYV